MMLEQAKATLELAKQEVQSIQYSRLKNAAVSVKNEVMEMIAKVRERKGRLDLPIVSGKHLRRISDRTALQSADNAEKFITTRKIDSFESLAKFTEDRVNGLLDEENYSMLSVKYRTEQQQLDETIKTVSARIEETKAETDDAKRWVDLIQKYSAIYGSSPKNYP